ncbi:MAG: type II toxin-antitoxin system VapC family toxin [Acidobacteria bacterium]|nr:type II toxin-antitoxin system VapC family toxin [Acidobacteriota bacterium]
MLIDTSDLYSFFDEKDFRHADALAFVKSANVRLTTSYVLAEFIPLCQTRALNRKKTLDFVKTIIVNPLIEIVWINEDLHGQAFMLLQKRLDKTYSLCDAVSFVVMRERGLTEALTTNKHFEQEGFIKLLSS